MDRNSPYARRPTNIYCFHLSMKKRLYKASLCSHAHVGRSVHRVTAVTSITAKTHFVTIRLGPGPKEGDYLFPTHSGLNIVR